MRFLILRDFDEFVCFCILLLILLTRNYSTTFTYLHHNCEFKKIIFIAWPIILIFGTHCRAIDFYFHLVYWRDSGKNNNCIKIWQYCIMLLVKLRRYMTFYCTCTLLEWVLGAINVRTKQRVGQHVIISILTWHEGIIIFWYLLITCTYT